MKRMLSIVAASLVTLFLVGIAPVHKSLVYAQSTPPGVSNSYASVGEDQGVDVGVDESGDISEQKAGKIVACDGFGYVWTLTIKGTKVTGTCKTTTCGTRMVTGTYIKKKINMKATTKASNECCEWFTYTGTFNKKTKVGSGTWANSSDCGGSGSWTMAKCN